MSSRRAIVTFLAVLTVVGGSLPLAAQSALPLLTRAYGRSVIEVQTGRANPGGVFGVSVRGGRWVTANTLLDGRRGAIVLEGGRLFGLIPVALDTAPSEHKLSLYFPGGRKRGGATTVMVPVAAVARPSRSRVLSSDGMAAAATQTALGHGRFLLGAIRTRDPQNYHTGPLGSPVDAPITFPFGGMEDYGLEMGPVKDGLIGEHHRGVDYDAAPGTTVKAPGAGIVLLARSLVFSGETVVIGHGRGLVSVLSHLTHVSVREGEVVAQGMAVGTSGKTGIGAPTPHVCFSVYLHSLNVDPEALMDATLWPAPATK